MSTSRSWLLALTILAGLATQAFPAESAGSTRPPPAYYFLEIKYLELKTAPGTVAPMSMLEYEVRLDSEAGPMTEAEAEARALQIAREGAVLGPVTDRRAVPAHHIQAVTVTRLAT